MFVAISSCHYLLRMINVLISIKLKRLYYLHPISWLFATTFPLLKKRLLLRRFSRTLHFLSYITKASFHLKIQEHCIKHFLLLFSHPYYSPLEKWLEPYLKYSLYRIFLLILRGENFILLWNTKVFTIWKDFSYYFTHFCLYNSLSSCSTNFPVLTLLSSFV